jgi:hypothetical protein
MNPGDVLRIAGGQPARHPGTDVAAEGAVPGGVGQQRTSGSISTKLLGQPCVRISGRRP